MRTGDQPRVVSLVPSATETLQAWGVTPVAVTRFCDVAGVPTVGGTKNPDIAAIVELSPDLVVMCDEENRRQDAEALEAAGVGLHVLVVRSVAEVAPALEGLANRLGLVPAPPASALPPPPGPPRLRAFVPIWRRPWMTLNRDTYGDSLLAAAGVSNVFAEASERYPEVGLEQAAARHPDVVLAPSEPYPFGPRHTEELAQVAPVVPVDGRDLFWWGTRTPGAVTRVAAQLGTGGSG
ncbi:MAG TPA: helical backbone metal receptor [Acidimicrobiales bacterium]|nr:helical backbone metal receptor [Acidimicrobiales bacterium]